ncbi:MAG TPA: sialidase family protein [Vicinamibacterales bacterium]|nr:sialidase family protein [Vicinamibacterales bacterium]
MLKRLAVAVALLVTGSTLLPAQPSPPTIHSYIAFDGIRVEHPAVASTGIFVRRTIDGVTWEPPVTVIDHRNTVMPFEDKPWVVVDRTAASPHRGNVYIAWTRFDVYGSTDPEHRSTIWFARSRDGGRSFQPTNGISDDTGDAKDSDGTLEEAVPAVGPEGQVYVVWAGPRGLSFDRSDDGGWTFGTDRLIGTLAAGWDLPVPGVERHNGMPATSVDLSSGPNRGSLYVNYIDERDGDTDVFLLISRDGGDSWGTPVRVNDDPKGAVQMFTWMAVDPTDGSIDVVFHDRRGLSGTMTGVTLARSIDGGRTFVNHAVPVEPFDCCAASGFVGDYNGLDAYGGRVVAVFPVIAGGQQRIMAASMRFRSGTQTLM